MHRYFKVIEQFKCSSKSGWTEYTTTSVRIFRSQFKIKCTGKPFLATPYNRIFKDHKESS